MQERILGVDYGERRIGFAVSDGLGITAQPVGMAPVASVREALRAVGTAAEAQHATHIVFGLPKSLSGAIGPKAQETIRFVAYYQRSSTVPVSLWDERFTTAAAERVLIEADMSRGKRRKKIDMLAAQMMLQGYLDSQRWAAAQDGDT